MANPKLGLFHMHESNNCSQLDAKLLVCRAPHVAEDRRGPPCVPSSGPYPPTDHDIGSSETLTTTTYESMGYGIMILDTHRRL